MRFRSAVDSWLIVVFAAAWVLCLFAVLPVIADGMWILGSVTLVVALGLPMWLLTSTWYEVDDEWLRVRSGPLRWKVRRSEISAVRPSRSVLSSPALSLDRLEIRYGPGRKILVSPADRQGFIKALGFSETR